MRKSRAGSLRVRFFFCFSLQRLFGGDVAKDFAGDGGGWFFDFDLAEGGKEVGVGAFEKGDLLRGAFGDGEEFAAGHVAADESGEAEGVGLTLSDFKEFDEVAEVEDGVLRGGFAAEFVATFLPKPRAPEMRREPLVAQMGCSARPRCWRWWTSS
jgi:hypothetical protein